MLRRVLSHPKAAIVVGAALGIATTAEGVETLEQLRAVRAEGCTQAQGFLLGRPVASEKIEGFLRR